MRQNKIEKSTSGQTKTRGAQRDQADQTDDEPPRDLDAFRTEVARRLEILIANAKGYWRGCKQPACRRQRGCCAPRVHCSNAPPLPPDPDGRRRARGQAMLVRALNAAEARGEAEQVEKK